MRNNIINFNFNNLEVRTTIKNNNPYFCLADCCNILNLKQSSRVLERLEKGGVTQIKVIDNLGREQQANFIDEPNLYRVIFRSDKPEAKQFQDWVFEEVLPTLRKTGSYNINKCKEIFTSPVDKNGFLTYHINTRIFNRNKLRYVFKHDIPYFLTCDIFELFEIIDGEKLKEKLKLFCLCLDMDTMAFGLTISQIIEIIAYLKNERSSLFYTILEKDIIPYFDKVLPMMEDVEIDMKMLR